MTQTQTRTRTRTRTRIDKPEIRSCAPLHKQTRRTRNAQRVPRFTCFTIDELREIARARHLAFSKNSTVKSLRALIERDAGTLDEYAWIEGVPSLSSRRASHLKRKLRPKVPDTWRRVRNLSDTWLTNFDIENVLRQYEIADGAFKLLAIANKDLRRCASCNVRHGSNSTAEDDEVHRTCRSLLETDLTTKLASDNITRIACVFNTGTHDGEGIHWVALYVDLDARVALYYDPIGCPPFEDVNVFLDHLDALSVDVNLRRLFYDGSRAENGSHQRPGSSGECGVYCIYFIERMLEASASSTNEHEIQDEFASFARSDIPQEVIVKLRRRFFYDAHNVVSTLEKIPVTVDATSLRFLCSS